MISLIPRSRLCLLSVLLLSISPPTFSQTGANLYYNQPATMSGKTVVIPAGTTIEGRIDTTISSVESKHGQRFIVEMTSPLLINGADVLIPAGATILGEVVESIPAKQVPHAKGIKPTGKLRIQMNTLKMPDGTVYPLVASLIGEQSADGADHNHEVGGGVGYSGSSNNFEAVSPGRNYGQQRGRGGNPGLHVVTKQELLQDTIMGKDKTDYSEKFVIRSLVKKKHNLYIYQGSPLTVHLDAPLKMGVGITQSAVSPLEVPSRPINVDGVHQRFSPQAPPAAPPTPVVPGASNKGADF